MIGSLLRPHTWQPGDEVSEPDLLGGLRTPLSLSAPHPGWFPALLHVLSEQAEEPSEV